MTDEGVPQHADWAEGVYGALGYGAVILGIFLGDLWIKKQVEESSGEITPILGGRILLLKHHNKGVVLNLGQNHRRIVAAASVGLSLLMALVFLLSLGHGGTRLLRTGLALLLGGAFSNTYDRLKRKYVVDYLSFNVKWKRLRRVVFNLSDFCILIGAMLVVTGSK